MDKQTNKQINVLQTARLAHILFSILMFFISGLPDYKCSISNPVQLKKRSQWNVCQMCAKHPIIGLIKHPSLVVHNLATQTVWKLLRKHPSSMLVFSILGETTSRQKYICWGNTRQRSCRQMCRDTWWEMRSCCIKVQKRSDSAVTHQLMKWF